MVQPTIVIMTITASMTLDVGVALSNGATNHRHHDDRRLYDLRCWWGVK